MKAHKHKEFVDRRTRSLILLARVEAAAGLSGAVLVYIYDRYNPGLLEVKPIIILGIVTALYFASLHQLFKKNHLDRSVLALTLLLVAQMSLIILGTGGLDSPFYSLWLLVLIASGIFGPAYTLAAIGGTIVYLGFDLAGHQLNLSYLSDHASLLLITAAAGFLAHWVHTSVRQITETTQALSGQLTQEQLKGQAIMNSMAEGVIVINRRRQIVLANRAAQVLTGWDSTNSQNLDLNLVFKLVNTQGQPAGENQDPVTEAYKKGVSVDYDTLILSTRSGRRIPLWISVSPIYDDGHTLTGAIILFRDVSREKDLERQRSEFISTASHEMRTPVASIEGYLSLAMTPATATIDPRAKTYLDKAHESTRHLGKLLQDLLTISKIEDGRTTGELELVDLGQLVARTVEDLQFNAAKKNLKLIMAGDQAGAKTVQPICWVWANCERLREVLTNLIDNAIKYTPQGSITVSLKATDKDATVSVADTGPGVSPEDLPHLFQKFYRVDSSATRTVGGSGLGLYLCRLFVEMYNGRIWAQSNPGSGSIFNFSLPRLSPEQARQHQKTAAAATVAKPAPAPAPTPAPNSAPAPVAVKPVVKIPVTG